MEHRAHISAEERRILSRIRFLMKDPAVLRANLVQMKRKCGNKNCRCTKGKLHKSWYLYQSKDGKPQMLYIPSKLEKEVREWVKKNKEIRELLDQLSQIYWDKVKKRKV